MNQSLELEWEFGGFLSGSTPVLAWLVLFHILVIVIGLTWFSYRRAVRPLSHWQLGVLLFLRTLLCLAILLCLANPTIVRRASPLLPDKKALTVLIDCSESMMIPDNRGRSRFENALRVWDNIRPNAEKNFDRIDYWCFAEKLVRVNSFEEATDLQPVGRETRLFESLAKLISTQPSEGYGPVLTVTDALDTSLQSPSRLISQAIFARVPLSFLPAENRSRNEAAFRIRQVDVPDQVIRKTQFTYNAVIETFLEKNDTVKVELCSGNTIFSSETLSMKSGRQLVQWSHQVNAEEAGEMHLELRISGRGSQKSVFNSVNVTEKLKLKVLYYQGVLDWGFHFFSRLLEKDSSFEVTALFNPRPDKHIQNGAISLPGNQFPDEVAELKNFQIIILANAFIEHLTEAQQHTLIEYTQNGGGLLFILPGNEATTAFAGSPLEEILPVIFERSSSVSKREAASETFLEQINRNLGSVTDMNENSVDGPTEPTPLIPFKIPGHSALVDLLIMRNLDQDAHIVPRFYKYAKLKGTKPGSEILAVHPTEKDPATGEPRVLFARQRFGKGSVSVLTTDSLWQWSISLPSGSADASNFWQQLLFWLARSSSKPDVRFVSKLAETPAGEEVRLIIEAGLGKPKVTVRSADEDVIVLPVSAGSEKGLWQVQFTPPQPGVFKFEAGLNNHTAVQHILSVLKKVNSTADLSGLPSDIEQMQVIASATGGQVLKDSMPVTWKTELESGSDQFISEHRRLLWNNWGVLLGCLVIYCADLLWRRRCRLI